jgi:hypothetical protein
VVEGLLHAAIGEVKGVVVGEGGNAIALMHDLPKYKRLIATAVSIGMFKKQESRR